MAVPGKGCIAFVTVKSQSGAFNGKVLATCSGTEVRVCLMYCEKHLPYKHTLSSEVLYTATKNLQVLITAIKFLVTYIPGYCEPSLVPKLLLLQPGNKATVNHTLILHSPLEIEH